MRVKLTYTIIASLLISCSPSSTEDDTVVEEESNLPPTSPTLISPVNNLLCTDEVLNFEWNISSDPEDDAIQYEIEIGTDQQFSDLYMEKSISGQSTEVELNSFENYYWRVRAKDIKGNVSEFSEVRTLSTDGEAETNHLPGSPELISPENGTKISDNDIELSWDCTDLDDDSLTFDLYLGTSENPDIKEQNLEGYSIIISSLPPNTYYWKVNAKDGNGGIAEGQLWNFEVE
ncbi:hypothetical protein NE848_05960 [Gramella jeungdoensis]|uniref:Fibronectin type-III domain-containing protein n=1 Tax=Gramella jeungdoensis TaxID=708091 RepID=A0ABT0YZN0_9FLAO|nr:hypothetical protein [Gramella jeungdoensis]MCM8568913.1 hypothetical protein [Gramella jeungdoensis]